MTNGIRVRSVTPAQKVILLGERNGIITATGRYDQQVIQKLVSAHILTHRHGLVYEVTDEGRGVINELRAGDLVID